MRGGNGGLDRTSDVGITLGETDSINTHSTRSTTSIEFHGLMGYSVGQRWFGCK